MTIHIPKVFTKTNNDTCSSNSANTSTMASLPKTYKAAVMVKPNEPIVIKELELKQPGPGQVLVKVIACGVCHTDLFEATGAFGDVFPRVPGHEIVGDVVAVGERVSRFSNGDRVGGPWHGGEFRPGHNLLPSPFPLYPRAEKEKPVANKS